MKWCERILRYLAELYGAMALPALIFVASELEWARGLDMETTRPVLTGMALAAVFALSWAALLTAAARALWKTGWREAFARMGRAFGRGALLLVMSLAALAVLVGLENAIGSRLGLTSILYWYH